MTTITKENNSYKNLNFVVSAINKKDAIIALTKIFIRDNMAYGSDGHRIYGAKVENIENGLYNFKCDKSAFYLLEKEDSIKYPDIDTVISKKENCKKGPIVSVNKKRRGIRITEILLSIFETSGAAIDSDFIYSLPEDSYTIYGTDKDSPVMLESDDKIIVLMPFRRKC